MGGVLQIAASRMIDLSTDIPRFGRWACAMGICVLLMVGVGIGGVAHAGALAFGGVNPGAARAGKLRPAAATTPAPSAAKPAASAPPTAPTAVPAPTSESPPQAPTPAPVAARSPPATDAEGAIRRASAAYE